MNFDFDLFVIGGGSGGVRAGRKAAAAGFKVGLAEEYRMGGTCVIRGCVPKKLMVYASSFRDQFEDARGYGWDANLPDFSWETFQKASQSEVDRLESVYAKNFIGAGGQLFEARARLSGPHEVDIEGHGTVRAKHILIATGGRPFVPDFEGNAHVITSNEVFQLEQQPKRLLILGGGYIACEFAGIFNGLGTQVTQLYRGDQILRGFDHEIRDFIADHMKAKGIDLRVNSDVASVAPLENELEVRMTSGEAIRVDCVLAATGRQANTADLGLEALGVKLSKKSEILVDEYSQTNLPSIYAVGDVTGRVALTPVAIHEAMCFFHTVFEGNSQKVDHALIPTAVFTQPEIGKIGINEDQADEEVQIYRATFRPMNFILAGRDEKMFFKMIVSKATQKILGLHVIGHGAAEMIQMAAVAIKMGATKSDFDKTMAVHPTVGEELVTLY